MRRVLFLSLLPILPAMAELEVVSSQLVSRRPDGIGQVVEADLDGDGDRDLLVTGRRNDFLGWMENAGGSVSSNVRPIDIGNHVVRGLRPMLASLDGGALPDLRFPGWKLQNLFRSYAAPQPHPESADHEFLAAASNAIVARSTTNGHWSLFTEAGEVEITTDAGILSSPAAPPEGMVLFGDLDHDGIRDLIAVLDGATVGPGIPLQGIYCLAGKTGGGFGAPESLDSRVPETLAPLWSSAVPERLMAVLFGTDTAPDGPAPVNPWTCRLHAVWHEPSDSYFRWQRSLIRNISAKGMGLCAAPAESIYHARIVVRLADNLEGSLPRVEQYDTHTTGHYYVLAERVANDNLSEPEPVTLLPSGDSLLVAYRSDGITPSSETIRRIGPNDRSELFSNPGMFHGRLLAGPFGTLDSAEWQDLEGFPRLVASTSESNEVLLIDPASPRYPATLALTPAQLPYGLIAKPGQPPFAADFDGDGDTDLIRPVSIFGLGYSLLFENTGDGQFSLSTDRYPYLFYSFLSNQTPLRVEYDSTRDRRRLLFQQPGGVFSQFISPDGVSDLWFPEVVAYPGTGAQVVAADQDIDGDGHLDFIFFPSVYGNTLAWGKWNPEGNYLDSLLPVQSHAASVHVPKLERGDLQGDGTQELYHASLDSTGLQVTWVASRISAGTLEGVDHPPVTLPEAASHVLPLDLDDDGDLDLLRLVPDPAAPAGPDGIRPHELRWTEYFAGQWIHHGEVLAKLRTSPTLSAPVTKSDGISGGRRALLINRIGEILELRTRAAAPSSTLATLLMAKGVTGASAGASDDPDGDGIPNFAEILAGTSPMVADPGFTIPLSMLATAPNHGWIARLDADLASAGATARLETSDDLNGWTRHAEQPLPLGTSGGQHRYLFSDSALASPPARRFARIVFTQE